MVYLVVFKSHLVVGILMVRISVLMLISPIVIVVILMGFKRVLTLMTQLKLFRQLRLITQQTAVMLMVTILMTHVLQQARTLALKALMKALLMRPLVSLAIPWVERSTRPTAC